MSKAISTLLELRRRKVFRGIGYYLVGAWTLLQVAEVVLEPAGLPSWSLTALLYFAVVGFPLAVWMAWRYELTDHGLVRTRPATEADSKADYSLKTSDYIIFGAMVAVIAAIAWQGLSNIRLEAVQTESSLQAEAEAQREALENSVAVLPFSDLSQSADQAYLDDAVDARVALVGPLRRGGLRRRAGRRHRAARPEPGERAYGQFPNVLFCLPVPKSHRAGNRERVGCCARFGG